MVANPARGQQAEQGKLIFPCPRSRLIIWSPEAGSAVLSRVNTHAEYAYFRDSSRVPQRRPYIYLKTDIRDRVSPELIGSRNAYRRRSLPRVRRPRASKPQGSSKRVPPWQVTMNQLICASLSRTHYRTVQYNIPSPTHYHWNRRKELFQNVCLGTLASTGYSQTSPDQSLTAYMLGQSTAYQGGTAESPPVQL